MTNNTRYANDVVFISYLRSLGSRDSSVAIATGYELEDRGIGIQVPVGQDFSDLHVVQTLSGAHQASCPMVIEGSLPEDKAAGS
jgi:hypothetical protein